MEANLQLHQTSIQAVPERRNTVNAGRQRHSFKQQMNRKHQSMMQNQGKVRDFAQGLKVSVGGERSEIGTPEGMHIVEP